MRTIVERYYDENPQQEWDRLDRHRIEFAITMRAMEEYLLPAPARILDLGGGPGRYAIALAQRGYRVTLADLSEVSLRFARDKASEYGVELEDYIHVNALQLEALLKHVYDAVLVMGPLYHLLQYADRLQVVRDVKRLLKPGGRIFASFICRYSPFRDGATVEPSYLFTDVAYSWRMLKTGIHDNSDGFTQAHFAHPDEIFALMKEGGFRQVEVLSQEGFLASIDELPNKCSGVEWDTWVDMNYCCCKDPYLLGSADHILFIGENI